MITAKHEIYLYGPRTIVAFMFAITLAFSIAYLLGVKEFDARCVGTLKDSGLSGDSQRSIVSVRYAMQIIGSL